MENDNPTALFEHGLQMCGSYMKLEEGMEHLHRASRAGHETATYLLGLMLACRHGPTHDRVMGMKLIRKIKTSIGKNIVRSRRQLEKLVGQRLSWNTTYTDEYMPIQIDTYNHTDKCRYIRKWAPNSFLGTYDPDVIDIETDLCEGCIWDLESKFFFHLYC